MFKVCLWWGTQIFKKKSIRVLHVPRYDKKSRVVLNFQWDQRSRNKPQHKWNAANDFPGQICSKQCWEMEKQLSFHFGRLVTLVKWTFFTQPAFFNSLYPSWVGEHCSFLSINTNGLCRHLVLWKLSPSTRDRVHFDSVFPANLLDQSDVRPESPGKRADIWLVFFLQTQCDTVHPQQYTGIICWKIHKLIIQQAGGEMSQSTDAFNCAFTDRVNQSLEYLIW